jgi:hypothetical protein
MDRLLKANTTKKWMTVVMIRRVTTEVEVNLMKTYLDENAHAHGYL